jgi:hypothetical protein
LVIDAIQKSWLGRIGFCESDGSSLVRHERHRAGDDLVVHEALDRHARAGGFGGGGDHWQSQPKQGETTLDADAMKHRTRSLVHARNIGSAPGRGQRNP